MSVPTEPREHKGSLQKASPEANGGHRYWHPI